MNKRVIQSVEDGNQTTVTNQAQTSIAPTLVIKRSNDLGAQSGSVHVHLEVTKDMPTLCFSFLNEHQARVAIRKPKFLSCAIWKALPMMGSDMIDEVIDSFVRPEDLYDRQFTFNKMADNHLREAGVFCISPVNLH